MKKITLLIYCLLFNMFIYVPSISAQLPRIENDKIIFLGGKTLKYTPSSVLNVNPEDFRTRKEGVSILEVPTLIYDWERLVIIKTMRLYEGCKKDIIVYDNYGVPLHQSYSFIGREKLLIKKKRIFLAQKSAHYLIKKSVIMDINGGVINEVDQDADVFEFGYSEDEELIWILSRHVKFGRPLTRVKVIDFNGNVILIKEVSEAQKMTIMFNGKDYNILIDSPDIPG